MILLEISKEKHITLRGEQFLGHVSVTALYNHSHIVVCGQQVRYHTTSRHYSETVSHLSLGAII